MIRKHVIRAICIGLCAAFGLSVDACGQNVDRMNNHASIYDMEVDDDGRNNDSSLTL